MRQEGVIHCAHDRDLPDAGGGACCMGSAVYGPGRCTCWETVYDVEQKPIRPGPMPQREKLCSDCAFRPDSPERNGDPKMAHSGDGEIEEIVYGRGHFICHEGVRRRVRLVHPGGAVVEVGDGAYEPPIVDGIAYRADGSPASKCAGIHAARIRAGLIGGCHHAAT